MKVYRFRRPYRKDGRTNFPDAKGRKGVYIIKVDGKITYIGHSGSDLYRTMYRHFQSWTDPTQRRVTYKGRVSRDRISVRVAYTNTARQAATLERALILKYKPRDNPDKLELYQPTASEKRALQQYDTAHLEPAPF